MLHFLTLPIVAIKVKLQELLWQWRVRKRYYHQALFKECDQALIAAYSTQTPYEISKYFMRARGEVQIHVYGETPVHIYERMARLWGLKSEHHFVELGSGRGRGLFFLATFYGCQCYGIEWIGEFVHKGSGLHPQVHLYHEDFMTSSHIQGDFLYLYGTCLEDTEIEKLCERFLTLDKKCKFITVSFPLSDYHQEFKTIDQFEGTFPWGRGTVFLNQRKEIVCPGLL